ncbi:MAG TPA: hypothetical protein VEL07_16720 [Planctomycetota bacterium]|nr:hypothetical protein [Planctomycetota bacterium]
MRWSPVDDVPADSYRAFRAVITLARAALVELRVAGASWYGLWVDDVLIGHGPTRHPNGRPVHDVFAARLGPGAHVIALQLHHVGIETRMLLACAPFAHVELSADGQPFPAAWRTAPCAGYARALRRINPQLGWSEWRDTRAFDDAWRRAGFVDAAWEAVAASPVALPPGADAPPPRATPIALTPSASGTYADRYGYEADDPPLRFLLRDLAPTLPAQGVWRRYDLGRVRLGVPCLVIEAPAGSVVEAGLAEQLTDGRVAPVITLSLAPSCNLDRWVLAGGAQQVLPLTPKGGRWLEVHVRGDPARIRFVDERFIDRGYHGEPEGAFACDDALLTRCWAVGVDTYRACAEDAVVDNPTRERGAWLGDAAVALPIAAAAYADLRLCRRGLVLAAECARADGLLNSLPPGDLAAASTYAMHWYVAVRDHHRLTGDRELLSRLLPAARRCFALFAANIGERLGALAWSFIDWGYVPAPGVDLALHLHLVAAARAYGEWCGALGAEADRAGAATVAAEATAVVRASLAARRTSDGIDWDAHGYHVAALALANDLVTGAEIARCIAAIERHLHGCFPYDPAAPRLADPGVAERRLATPYFAHHAFPGLFAHGAADIALDQFRRCWGWGLAQGWTTWMEVFDPRWSHCHQWSGAPTWQLTRYVLGLTPRFDLGARRFILDPRPGSLTRAEGRVPVAGRGDHVAVAWTRDGDELVARIAAGEPIWLVDRDDPTRETRVVGEVSLRLAAR